MPISNVHVSKLLSADLDNLYNNSSWVTVESMYKEYTLQPEIKFLGNTVHPNLIDQLLKEDLINVVPFLTHSLKTMLVFQNKNSIFFLIITDVSIVLLILDFW